MAGTRKGIPNKTTQSAVELAKESGLLPLDIMLANARWAHEQAEATAPKASDFSDKAPTPPEEHLKFRRLANEFSKDAAPYIHSKLSSVDQKLSGTVTLEQLVTESYGAPAPQPTAPQPVKH